MTFLLAYSNAIYHVYAGYMTSIYLVAGAVEEDMAPKLIISLVLLNILLKLQDFQKANIRITRNGARSETTASQYL